MRLIDSSGDELRVGDRCSVHAWRWCIYGVHKSKQVSKSQTVVLTGAALRALGTFGLISAPINVAANELGGLASSVLDND